MKLPQKTYIGLKMLNKGKPNAQYFQFYNGENYHAGYENIKTGGRIIWKSEKTLSATLKKVEKELNELKD